MYKVLVVEDEPIIRKGLVHTVDWGSLGCVVAAEASNGREGLRRIEAVRPDIVITDIRMPLMDGIEMVREGQKLHAFETIILSGYGEFEYAQTAIRLGVGEYLLKPVETDKLAEAIRRLSAKRGGAADRAAGAPEGARAAPVLDLGLADARIRTASRHVAEMLRHIRDHYAEKVSLKELSARLEISATYLNQKFKEETAYTFNDFLNRYRIQKAIGLLEEGKLRIYEIAERVGFSDYKYFIMVFHKYVGCAPTEFMESGRSAAGAPAGREDGGIPT